MGVSCGSYVASGGCAEVADEEIVRNDVVSSCL